jgi:predicted Zn finger-like uncharacterized protein
MTETSQVVYHAQCPHCATIRKISHAQLQAAKGLVQCRQCDETYLARGNLLKPDQLKLIVDQPSIVPSATPTPVTITPPPQFADHSSDTTTPTASETAALDDIFERLAAEANDDTRTPVNTATENKLDSADDSAAEPAKKVKSSGLFAKLLSRKNQYQAPAEDNDIIFESIDMEDGFLNNKAQLHVDADVRPQGVLMEHISEADRDEMVKKYRENKNAAKKRPVNEAVAASGAADALLATLQGLDTAPAGNTTPAAEKPTPSPDISHADDFVFQIQEDANQFDDVSADDMPAHEPAIKTSSHHSKLQSLLVREQTEERAHLTEADVIAPDYDASKEWFTQFFNSLNQNQAMSILGNPDLQADAVTLDENGEPIAAAKRMHEGGSNTVAMRLPENSMLVFTLEDDGTSHSQLSFIDIQEHLPHKTPETTHTTIVQQSNHNEHTIWTVACIVAILVLIIQMFYYFLLLTP